MIWLLLIVYQLKHFIADYPLQGKFMLGKFKPYPACILPLLSHGLVHGVFTFLIALYFKDLNTSLMLGALDMAIHSGVDYVKANPELGGSFKALTKDTFPTATPEQVKSNTLFWWSLGADQMAHHLTHYLLIWIILS